MVCSHKTSQLQNLLIRLALELKYLIPNGNPGNIHPRSRICKTLFFKKSKNKKGMWSVACSVFYMNWNGIINRYQKTSDKNISNTIVNSFLNVFFIKSKLLMLQ